MAKTCRARIIRELDDQYTLLIYKRDSDEARDRLQSTTSNLTLATAFNTARDTLNAFAVGLDRHEEIVITDRIEAD